MSKSPADKASFIVADVKGRELDDTGDTLARLDGAKLRLH